MFAYIPDSNGGGEIIRESTLVSWKAGKKREELKLEDLETALSSSAFNYCKSDTLRCAFCEAGGCALPSLLAMHHIRAKNENHTQVYHCNYPTVTNKIKHN